MFAEHALPQQRHLEDPVEPPGVPWENGYNVSFNAKLRNELLNTDINFMLKQAKVLIQRWQHHTNTVRQHSIDLKTGLTGDGVTNLNFPVYAVDRLLEHQLIQSQTLT